MADRIDRDIEAIVDELLSPEAQSRIIAEFARAQFAEADAVNAAISGRPVPSTRAVDGVVGAPEERARPGSTIAYEWSLRDAVVERIWNMLVEASPKRSGRYAGSHLVFADGVEVKPGNEPADAREYVIVNAQPYARKIERGQSGPAGVYQGVAAVAKSLFDNAVQVRFTYRSLADAGASDLVAWARKTKLSHRRHASRVTRHDWLTRQPAIVITYR